MKKENRCLNNLKAIACILVVLNHFHGTGNIGTITYTISHLGVPIFFIISGYFLYNIDTKNVMQRLPRKISHIFQLLCIHITVYIFYYIIQALINGTGHYQVVYNIKQSFTFSSIKNSLIWSESLYGSGQWFLIALLEAYIIFYFICKLKIYNVVKKYSLWISLVFFLIHILLRLFLIKNGISHIGTADIYSSSVVRNVWLDAIPFMLLGIYINEHNKLFGKNKLILGIAITSVVISILEAYIVKTITKPYIVSSVLYFGTIVCVYFSFLFAIYNPDTNCKLLEIIGKKLSMIIFFIHPIIGLQVENFLSRYSVSKIVFVNLRPIIIVVVTIIVSYCVYKFVEFIKTKFQPKVITTILFLSAMAALILSFLPESTLQWEKLCICYWEEEALYQSCKIEPLSKYQDIMLTVQNEEAKTIVSEILPIQQFIGGAAILQIPNENVVVNCIYKSEDEIVIECYGTVSQMLQIRLWGR